MKITIAIADSQLVLRNIDYMVAPNIRIDIRDMFDHGAYSILEFVNRSVGGLG